VGGALPSSMSTTPVSAFAAAVNASAAAAPHAPSAAAANTVPSAAVDLDNLATQYSALLLQSATPAAPAPLSETYRCINFHEFQSLIFEVQGRCFQGVHLTEAIKQAWANQFFKQNTGMPQAFLREVNSWQLPQGSGMGDQGASNGAQPRVVQPPQQNVCAQQAPPTMKNASQGAGGQMPSNIPSENGMKERGQAPPEERFLGPCPCDACRKTETTPLPPPMPCGCIQFCAQHGVCRHSVRNAAVHGEVAAGCTACMNFLKEICPCEYPIKCYTHVRCLCNAKSLANTTSIPQCIDCRSVRMYYKEGVRGGPYRPPEP
jgi:hypothetical protein